MGQISGQTDSSGKVQPGRDSVVSQTLAMDGGLWEEQNQLGNSLEHRPIETLLLLILPNDTLKFV